MGQVKKPKHVLSLYSITST